MNGLLRTMLTIGGLVAAASKPLGAFDFASSRQFGLGRAYVLSQPTATALVSAPVLALGRGHWQVEMGGNRRFELSDFDEVYLAGAYRRGCVVGTIGFSQFGDRDLYSERIIKFGAAYARDRLAAGATFSALFVSFGDAYEGLSAGTFGFAARYDYQRVTGALVIENITSPHLTGSSPGYNPTYNLYVETRGTGPYCVVGRATFEKLQPPQYALGQKLDVFRQASFMWGLATEPLVYGGGIELAMKRGRLSYNVSYHSTLGFSHNISVSYGGGPVEIVDSGTSNNDR